MGVIYKIQNVVTDDIYIGSAVKPKRRKWEHWTMLKKGTHHCKKLQEAWDEFGEDAFEFIELETVDDDKLLTIEDTYLVVNAGQPHCYNTALSSLLPSTTQLEVRAKISNTLKEGYSTGEYPHPRTGKGHSEETRALISQNRKGKMAGEGHYRYGKTVSDEVRKKIGDTQRGVKKGPRVYTEEGLQKARANMKRNARAQVPKDIKDVIAKFPDDIVAIYDFSNAVYTGALRPITGCICPEHGEFSQYAAQLRKGSACPTCGRSTRTNKKLATQ